MQEIEGYIRDHRHRHTREAIVAELEAAGHPRHEIDAAWDRIEGGEPLGGDATPLGRYAWIVYWIGAGLIILYVAFFGVGGAPGFIGLGAGWLLAYLALAYWPVRALARSRPSGLAGSLGRGGGGAAPGPPDRRWSLRRHHRPHRQQLRRLTT